MNLSRLLFALFICTLLVMPTTFTEAQSSDPTPIEFGDTVTATLESDESLWRFEARAGQFISIDLRSNDFDPRIVLRNQDGLTIREDDDSGPRLDALIKNYEIPDRGTYIIAVQGFNTDAQGVYTLSLVAEGNNSSNGGDTSGGPSQSLTIGDTVSGELDDSRDFWEFEADAGDSVTIELNSLEFDAYLVLETNDGQILVENDDDGPGFDARIANYNINADGTYRIVVRGYNGDATGSYSLTLSSGDGSNIQDAAIDGGQLSFNDPPVEDYLLSGDYEVWTFEGQEGDVVTISLDADEFDAYLQLYEGANTFNEDTFLIFDDDSGSEYNSRITNFRLPSTGTYTVVVSSYSGLGEGIYFLTLEGETQRTSTGSNNDDNNSDNPVYTLEIGETVEGILADNQHEWQLEAAEGDLLNIDLSSEVFDTFVEFLSEDGTLIEFNDDVGNSLNSRIEDLEIPEDGTYTILVRSYEGDGTGNYTLTVSGQTSLAPSDDDDDSDTSDTSTSNRDEFVISVGEEVNGTLNQDVNEWTLELEERTIVTISLISDDFDTVIEINRSNGQTVLMNDDGGDRTNSFLENEILDAGTYTIIVRGYDNNAAGDYLLSITDAEQDAVTSSSNEAVVAYSSINEGDDFWYVLAGSDEPLTITIEASNFIPYVEIFDTSNNSDDPLITSEADTSFTTVTLPNVEVTDSGYYAIQISSLNDVTAGRYTLIVDGETQPVLRNEESGYIQYGMLMYGVPRTFYKYHPISGQGDRWQFEAQEGDIITITVTSDVFAPTVSLSREFILTRHQNNQRDRTARIEDYLITEDGTYTITVRGPGGFSEAGEYEILVSLVGQEDLSDSNEIVYGGGEITYGRTVNGILNDDQDKWTFEGMAGDSIVIDINTDDFSQLIELWDSSDEPLELEQIPLNNPFERRYQVTLPDDGSYSIIVRSEDGNATGSYRMNLSLAE